MIEPLKADNVFMNLSRAMSKLIGAFAVYRIIKQQIDSNNYEAIDLSMFDHVVKQLLERNPDLKMFVAKLSSNVDTARLHERKIANFLYKQAEKTKGSPLNEAEELMMLLARNLLKLRMKSTRN